MLWVGASPVALIAAAALYAVRMLAFTGFYHRYFSHRTFRTWSRNAGRTAPAPAQANDATAFV